MPRKAYILVREPTADEPNLTICGLNRRSIANVGTFEEAEQTQHQLRRSYGGRYQYNIYTIIPVTRTMLEPPDPLSPIPVDASTQPATRIDPMPSLEEALEEPTTRARRSPQGGGAGQRVNEDREQPENAEQATTGTGGNSGDIPF